jgi:FkbM family methyltransferase
MNSLIFDIGCHKGEDTDFYLKRGHVVVAVEANPILCETLKQRFREEIKSGRFTLVDKAIAEDEGEITFFVNSVASIWGTIRSDWAARNLNYAGAPSEKITVSSIKFSQLIEQFGMPYYLKIDIEGADMLCLEGLLSFSERPKYVSAEVPDRQTLQKMATLLSTMGYDAFQLVDQSDFLADASGPFGEELPGNWKTKNRLILEYTAMQLRKRILRSMMIKFKHKWFDIHARLTEQT